MPTAKPMNSTLEPYLKLARFDRPVGTLLLLWPTLAALWIASGGIPAPGLLIVFIIGTVLMRAAGCVINDIADRRLDGHVSRTLERPLATGSISTRSAIGFFGLLTVSAGLLLVFLNPLTRWLAVAGLSIAVVYPFMKRWTYLPQVILGAAFSWGLVMAFSAVQSRLPPEAWLLFVASLMWIVAYDTMYAMVDREDDLKIGIKSTAILFGSADRLMIGILQLSVLASLALLGDQLGYQTFYYLGLLAAAGLFTYQQYLIRHRDRQRCFSAFTNNVWVGFAFFAGVVLELSIVPLLTSPTL
jgi:4-hydroxybenzoate polyprenyltransferase